MYLGHETRKLQYNKTECIISIVSRSKHLPVDRPFWRCAARPRPPCRGPRPSWPCAGRTTARQCSPCSAGSGSPSTWPDRWPRLWPGGRTRPCLTVSAACPASARRSEGRPPIRRPGFASWWSSRTPWTRPSCPWFSGYARDDRRRRMFIFVSFFSHVNFLQHVL